MWIIVRNCKLFIIFSIIFPYLNASSSSLVNGRAFQFEKCVNNITNEEGVCMFAMDCAKAQGKHVGVCIQRFYFGSCCVLNNKQIKPIYPDNSTNPAVEAVAGGNLSRNMSLVPSLGKPISIVLLLATKEDTTTITPSIADIDLDDNRTTSTTTVHGELVTNGTAIISNNQTITNTTVMTNETDIGGNKVTHFNMTINITNCATTLTSTTTIPTTSPTSATAIPSVLALSSTSTINLPSLSTTTISSTPPTKTPSTMTTTTTPSTLTSTVSSTSTTLTTSSMTKLTTVMSQTNQTTILRTPVIVTTVLPSTFIHTYKKACGKPKYRNPKIVGGGDALPYQWPWQVSLQLKTRFGYDHKCGAVLLNEEWVLTAAHCVYKYTSDSLLVKLGGIDFANYAENFVERKVEIFQHPKFNWRNFQSDIALLKMNKPVKYQASILPVCLPDPGLTFDNEYCVLTGWGRLEENGQLPTILQQVSVPVVNNSYCEEMYRMSGFKQTIDQSFICAGYAIGLKDACEGDSGGPMVVWKNGRWVLAGIISYGSGCARKNQPGVGTRVTEYLDWIYSVMYS